MFHKVKKENPKEFACVAVDVGGYGIIWGDELDLSCDEQWVVSIDAMKREYGVAIC